jgi:hypothetical protein
MLVTWTEDWVKKNSSVNFMTLHFRSSFEDSTHEANIRFMEGKGWFNTFKNDWQLYHIKCTGVGLDILNAIPVMGCYSKEQAALNTRSF